MASRGRGLVLGAAVGGLLVAMGGWGEPRENARPRAGSTPAPPQTWTPLALAVHSTRPSLDLDPVVARDLLGGGVRDWSELGHPAEPLHLVLGPNADPLSLLAAGPPAPGPRLTVTSSDEEAVRIVQRDAGAVAAVAGPALGPGVRALPVGGRQPAREPWAYPLRIPGPAPAPVVTTLAVGDIMLSRTVYRRMVDLGDWAAPFRATWRRLAAADITFGNFEGTVSCAGPAQHPHEGASFAADPRALRGLSLAGFDVVALANNHAGDFGPAAIVETVQRFREASIRTVGAGSDDRAALAPLVVERSGVRFGFLAFNGAGESPVAGSGTPGVAEVPMAPAASLDRSGLRAVLAVVRALRPAVDVLVVFAHWGAEYTHLANDDQVRVARALVRTGADVVVGAHPHWVQGTEIYRGKLIAYSLGNFVFDMDWSEETRRGVVLELTFWGADLKAAEFLPVEIEDAHRPRFLAPAEGQAVLERLWGASGAPFRLGRPRPEARPALVKKRILPDGPCAAIPSPVGAEGFPGQPPHAE